ncbi:hypothetical protein GW7_15399 [Heterocephalus glaber]|uniref:Uncharacterized protein n=1 Tax=Heterocephalus glaber TaxID=10181 RepID=G5BGW7_HETGA|nr:hypothetical protein GW7_15399 [Heterocephalus glaber]
MAFICNLPTTDQLKARAALIMLNVSTGPWMETPTGVWSRSVPPPMASKYGVQNPQDLLANLKGSLLPQVLKPAKGKGKILLLMM